MKQIHEIEQNGYVGHWVLEEGVYKGVLCCDDSVTFQAYDHELLIYKFRNKVDKLTAKFKD